MTTKKKPAPLSSFTNSGPATVAPSATTQALPPIGGADEKMRQKVFRLTPTQDRRLKEFCAHSDRNIQDVVLEGINLVLKQGGLPPL